MIEARALLWSCAFVRLCVCAFVHFVFITPALFCAIFHEPWLEAVPRKGGQISGLTYRKLILRRDTWHFQVEVQVRV
jgi:hypothetical protein